MPQSFASLHVHIVFSTKHRQLYLNDELRPRLFEYVGGILPQNDCALIAAGGTEDHVHLLTSLGRTIAVADAVRIVKSNSSGWIHDEFRELRDFQWQQGYGAFAVSFSNLDPVKQYLASQEEHHRKRSYQDEFPRTAAKAWGGVGRALRLGLIVAHCRPVGAYSLLDVRVPGSYDPGY